MYRYECKLVGTDPSVYVHAIVKNSLEPNVQNIADTYVDGSTWIMSNVTLDTKARSEYISGPIKGYYVVLEEKTQRRAPTSLASSIATNCQGSYTHLPRSPTC